MLFQKCTKFSSKTLYFSLTLVLFFLYAGFFIYNTSYVIMGTRYFSLFDDAMISMRYASNLAKGNGLVWNPGERIEGITNPGWTFIMALFHLLPLSPAKMSLPIQILSGFFMAGSLWNLVRTGKILGESYHGPAIAAAFLTAMYYPFIFFGLMGMETGLLSFLLSQSVYLLLKNYQAGKFSPIPYILLGLGTYVRLDFVTMLMASTMVMMYLDSWNWKKIFLTGIGVFFLFMGSQTLARYLYYGDIYPNTYYLKMTGYPAIPRIARGIYVTLNFLTGHFLVFAIPALVIAVIKKFPFKKAFLKSPLLLPAFLFGTALAYSCYVGGDAWEEDIPCNRYIVISVMYMFFLIALIGKYLSHHIVPLNLHHYILPSLLAALIFYFNDSSIAPRNYQSFVLSHPPMCADANENNTWTALYLEKVSKPNDKIATVMAGTLPYFSDRYFYDLLGKCDKYIARLPMTKKSIPSPYWYKQFYPGHMKWDVHYSFTQLKPDFVTLVLISFIKDARPLLESNYTRISPAGVGITTYQINHKSDLTQ